MTRLVATLTILAAVAMPASAQPSSTDHLFEARTSTSASHSTAVAKIKCKFVNGMLVCSF